MANDLSAQLQAKFNASAPDKEPERDTLGQLIALIHKVTGTEEDMGRETRLKDIGIESLDLVELTVRAETMLNSETIGDIAEYVEDHQ